MVKILFIEDDPDQIFLYDTYFRTKAPGILLIVATDESQAMALVHEEEPEMILADILLNGENGLDIVTKIKADPKFRDIPVVVFTNFDRKEERERAKRLGALDYLIKTKVVPDELLRRLKGYLDDIL
jgi:two-component system cell cycle response regulator